MWITEPILILRCLKTNSNIIRFMFAALYTEGFYIYKTISQGLTSQLGRPNCPMGGLLTVGLEPRLSPFGLLGSP